MKLFFVIFCLFVEIQLWDPKKKCWFSQKILIFTYDPPKKKLWVKCCKLDPKVVLLRFKNVFSSCFWDLLHKKSEQNFFLIGQILVIFWKNWKKHDFFMVFFWSPYFSTQNRQTTTKNHVGHPNCVKASPKKIIRHCDQNSRLNSKKLDPPIGPIGGGVFLKSSTFKLFYFLWICSGRGSKTTGWVPNILGSGFLHWKKWKKKEPNLLFLTHAVRWYMYIGGSFGHSEYFGVLHNLCSGRSSDNFL